MSNPEEHVKRLKETGAKMTKIEKILYLRITEGLGLIEANNKLKAMCNDFDGPWFEKKS